MKEEAAKFWKQRESWPVGQALFPASWAENEPWAELPSNSDDPPYVEATLRRDRWQFVVYLAGLLLREGALTSFSRHLDGGPFSGPLPSHIWNTENLMPRFGLCQIDLGRPFAQEAFTKQELDAFRSPAADWRATPDLGRWMRQDYRLIYVDAEGLDTCLKRLAEMHPPPAAIADQSTSNAPKTPNLANEVKALEEYLDNMVKASPAKLTHEFNKDIAPWMAVNTPSVGKKKYQEIRRKVLLDYPGHRWGQVR
jgi:hypothetical protein